MGYVDYIRLENLGFDGTMPANLQFPSLSVLALSDNQISGSFPVGGSDKLAFIYLERNALSGALPTSVGQLDSLKLLRISENKFSGAVPNLALLDELEDLRLAHNEFTTLPNLSALGALTRLELINNLFVSSLASLPSNINVCAAKNPAGDNNCYTACPTFPHSCFNSCSTMCGTPAPTPNPTPQPTPRPTPQPTPLPSPAPTPQPTPLPTPPGTFASKTTYQVRLPNDCTPLTENCSRCLVVVQQFQSIAQQCSQLRVEQ